MEKVKELLATTDEKIVSIAFSVGYSEPNYLSYLFKKREGSHAQRIPAASRAMNAGR
jgi:YesN/AraC family two-component response regulator